MTQLLSQTLSTEVRYYCWNCCKRIKRKRTPYRCPKCKHRYFLAAKRKTSDTKLAMPLPKNVLVLTHDAENPSP